MSGNGNLGDPVGMRRITFEIKVMPAGDDGHVATDDEITDALMEAIEGIGEFEVSAEGSEDGLDEVWRVDEANLTNR